MEFTEKELTENRHIVEKMELEEKQEAEIDKIPKNPTEGEAGFAAKILKSAQGAFSRATEKLASRGRGRPKNCKGCGNPETKCICAGGAPGALPGQAVGGAMAGSPLDRELVTKAVSGVIKAGCGVAGNALQKKAWKKTHDGKFAAEIAAQCAPTDDELNALGELAEICLRKYGVGTEYVPEIGVAAIVIGIGSRYAMAFSTINNLPDKKATDEK